MNMDARAKAFSWLQENLPQTGDEAAAAKANEAQMGEAALAQWEFARLFFDVFGTGRGPELLMELRNATIEVPLFYVSRAITQGGEVALSPADWAHYREGQNSIVRMIEEQISVARKPAPNVSAGDNQTEGDANA